MLNKIVFAAAISGLCLAGCSTAVGNRSMAQGPVTVAPNAAFTDVTPEAAGPYVMIAGASDLYELQSSQLHHQRGANRQLHAFAQMMIDHHSQTTAATLAAARGLGMTPPPPQLLPVQQAMIDRLQVLSGAEFDREYVRQQRIAHGMALALHSNYARSGDTPTLRTSASAAVPVVRQHQAQLRQIRI